MNAYNDPREEKISKESGISILTSQKVAIDSNAILRWIKDNAFEYIAVHFDLDVLDPRSFYSQFPNDPAVTDGFNTSWGKLTIPQVTRIIQDVSKASDIVELGFTEHMPWDACNLKLMMHQLPVVQ